MPRGAATQHGTTVFQDEIVLKKGAIASQKDMMCFLEILLSYGPVQ